MPNVFMRVVLASRYYHACLPAWFIYTSLLPDLAPLLYSLHLDVDHNLRC